MQELLSLSDEEKAKKFANQMEYEKAVLESENKIDELQNKQMQARVAKATTTMNAIGSVMGSMSQIISAFDDDSEESAKAQKAIALGEIAVQTGVAIAQGISSAMSVPFPGNLVANAKKTIESAKFADGGIVGGSNYSGDNVSAQVNSGEMILNRQQQTQLFAIANSGRVNTGIDYELLGATMAEAVASQPAPILDYSEFTGFRDKVVKLDEQIIL